MHVEPVSQAWAVDPLPALAPTTHLCADWPRDGLDPFDVTDRRTQRMLLVYAGPTRAWPASEGATPATDERSVTDVISYGRTTLSDLEKLAVVYRGRLIAEWPRFPGPPSEPARLPQFAVYLQRLHHVRHADDYRGALDLALALSADGDEPVMVVDVLSTMSWW